MFHVKHDVSGHRGIVVFHVKLSTWSPTADHTPLHCALAAVLDGRDRDP